MALIVKDRVKESTTTTGTADFTLGGAASGFQTFAIIGNTNTTYYAAVDQATGAWEVGVGTYSTTGPTLTRDTVLESSNSGSKVVFAAGSKEVFCTYPAERSVYLDAAGSAVTTLDIGTLGVSTANITTANITAGTVTTTPASGNDLVNKTYVDTLVATGIHFHQPVRVESPINLTATYNNGTAGVGATLTNSGTQVALVIDGVTVATNDRVLIYQQTTQTQNGIYVVTNTGSVSTNWVLTRASDADTYVINSANGLSEGSTVFVQQGSTGAGETYTCNTSGTITFGTTNITFAQISSAQIYSAGTGLTLSGTQFSIANTGTAGTYGSASTVPVFITNAQGQVTSVTPTGIAITSAAVSGLAASATTDTTDATNITSGTLPSARLNGAYANVTGVGTLASGIWNASAIAAIYGGTGLTSYVQGDLLYAASSTTVGRLADVVAGNALISGGVGGDPVWGKIDMTTHVDGVLPVANGGTGLSSLTANQIPYGNGTGSFQSSDALTFDGTTLTSSSDAATITPLLSARRSAASGNAVIAQFTSSGTTASPTAVVSGRGLGRNEWFGFDGTSYVNAAAIVVVVDGTVSTGVMPARIVLQTASTSGGGPVERVRIDSSGSVTSTGTITVQAAATQDAVKLQGRAGGSSSYAVTLTPTTLLASRTLTLPDSSGTVALTSDIPTINAGVATFLATPSSANLAAAVTDETGSGSLVFATSPTLTNPVLTTATATGITLNDGYTEEVFAVTGTTPALSPTNGSIQTWTLSANSTPTQGTWVAGQSIILMIDDGTARTITWTSIPVVWVGGSAPTLATTGFTVIVLWEVGTTIYGALTGPVA